MRLSRLRIKGASTEGLTKQGWVVHPLCERIVSQFKDNVAQCNKRKAFINFNFSFLGLKSDLRWSERVLWSDYPNSTLFLGKTDVGIYVPKMKKTIQTVTNKKCKTSLCDGMGDLHICEFTIDADACIGILERHMLPSKDDFSQELHVYFTRTMPGLILHGFQQRGFFGIECVCLTALPAVEICPLLYSASWRGESDHGDHRLLSSSSLVYTKNGQTFNLQNWNYWLYKDIYTGPMWAIIAFSLTKCLIKTKNEQFFSDVKKRTE